MHLFARRGVLSLPGKFFASILLKRRLKATAAPAISLEEFLALSERLTGRKGLGRGVGRIYLTALLADPGNGQRLAELKQGGSSHLSELERMIILSWYTGVYRLAGESRLATHTGALVWKSLGTVAPGSCVGPMGFWARPPAERR
jgi:hypothetical protein